MSSFHRAFLIFPTLLVFTFQAAHAQSRPQDFGQQWIRSHPFTLMGPQQWPHTFNVPRYTAANFNNTLVWWADGNGKQTAAISSQNNLPWHAFIVDGEGPEEERIPDYASVGNAAGWMIGDEIPTLGQPWYGNLAAWTKLNRPNDLVYHNVYPTYAPPEALYGGPPPGGTYTYEQYLEDTVQIMKPDVLMYDHYPFVAPNLQRHDLFINMLAVRDKAKQHNLPYWAFMQSFSGIGYRAPSESDLRMQAYAHLAAGYTGLSYFTFDSIFDYAILDSAGNPTPIYNPVQQLNAEVQRLGKALRFMSSDDVKFIPGQRNISGNIVKNATPPGLTVWTAANDSDDHMLDISCTVNGLGRDALIGFFTDDNGDACFMLQNLLHDYNQSAGDAFSSFSILFDNSVTELFAWTARRETRSSSRWSITD